MDGGGGGFCQDRTTSPMGRLKQTGSLCQVEVTPIMGESNYEHTDDALSGLSLDQTRLLPLSERIVRRQYQAQLMGKLRMRSYTATTSSHRMVPYIINCFLGDPRLDHWPSCLISCIGLHLMRCQSSAWKSAFLRSASLAAFWISCRSSLV